MKDIVNQRCFQPIGRTFCFALIEGVCRTTAILPANRESFGVRKTAKQEVMKKMPHDLSEFIEPPAFPFQGTSLWNDLKNRLAREWGIPIGYRELGKYTGESHSTTHFWVTLYRNPQLLAFMGLLERLSVSERHSFIDQHCRILPLLSDRRLIGHRGKLSALLDKTAGLTMIVGGSDSDRTFVLTALGHSSIRRFGSQGSATGIDIHDPKTFVPIETVRYISERLDGVRIRELVTSIWPRLMTSRARLFLGNRLWASVPAIRMDLLDLANRRHVILAEQSIEKVIELKGRRPRLIDVVSLTHTTPDAPLRINCHQVAAVILP